MAAETKSALTVKSQAVELMKEHVFRGDYDNPRVRPDSLGTYHYRDRKIEIGCQPSRREGWLNCMIRIYLVRRRWPLRRIELVFSTGYGIDIETYRPGRWVDYLFQLAEGIEKIQREREAERQQHIEEEEQRQRDASFSPVDDSSIFKK
ncbi:MAG: hypothetical protein L0229_30230 [Blastocatellia bacterium]|nr:hypothetical protein [Blastocatellia bacterium]